MAYEIRFFAGDWSDDGHGKGEDFYVLSNYTVKDLREVYFAACKKLKVRFDGEEKAGEKFDPPCAEYEDNTFSKELYNYLIEKGVVMPKFEEHYADPECYRPLAKQYIQMVLNVIMWFDPKVKLEFKQDDSETFHFYGSDKKRRHIGYFGYGLYE
jgi:hypothetical protein